ncbi:hypothetical protein PYW07_012517 [Mythimna separata]|uniref:Uncharacterized protein n=1 Tax=Mythimna separata TaxID=271217 RepID=A0AAD7Y846_MYTSE|nr:hypothetical protein PYW07_012517 [Mythimna separata]
MRTEHLDQASFCPFAPREVSVLAELALGHLRYSLTDVPPQSNYPPGSVLEPDHAGVVRRRALPPRRHSARLERNTVRPPILSTAHRFRPTEASLEYLLLPPRSAPTEAPSGLTPRPFCALRRARPTRYGLMTSQRTSHMPVTVVYRQNASAPSIFRAGCFGRAALSSNPTLRRVPLAAILRRYGPGTLYGKTAPFKTNLDRSDRDEKAEPPEHHISRRLNNGGIQCWASFLFARRY